ncbi:hypothetical protein FIBSPDRAFT_947515 [Athelia psychrophila]|uniref:HNH nuclease domain-containing protein n=1 Tax=Athelia psychrophila TaxID=1759441 RepID=A0A166RV50_9AGAM|nr:hypothetical protein FIBSPDRAFT_947515 [Fibularhizoctonia sp. CBS 109695]
MSSKRSTSPPEGFVHLILFSLEHPFYLEIPIDIVNKVSLRPLKYLRYLGWCVLGVEADLVDEGGNMIALDGDLLDQSIYRYALQNQDILAHAVDLEVIKERSRVPSETTRTREDFRTKLLERDGRCVWTGQQGVGMHIIPENLDSLNNINDIRNGIYACHDIHNLYFDPREVVVLKTPNAILATTDIPDRSQRNLAPDVSYPGSFRYTLQWIVNKEQFILERYPHNNDATFKSQRLPKPADLLLHYNYGAAAVKQWGKNISVLTDRPNIPRPSAPAPASMGPPKVNHDRNTAQDSWDEDDIMLYLWGNTKAARDRHDQKEQERTTSLENWRDAPKHPCPALVPALPAWMALRRPSRTAARATRACAAFRSTRTKYLHGRLKKLGFITHGPPASPIVPLLLGKLPYFHRMMKDRAAPIVAVVVAYLATSLVPGRVRFWLSAAHTKEDINSVLMVFDKIGEVLYLKHGTGERWPLADILSRSVELVNDSGERVICITVFLGFLSPSHLN